MSIIEKAAGKLEAEEKQRAKPAALETPAVPSPLSARHDNSSENQNPPVHSEQPVSIPAPATVSRRIALNLTKMRDYGIVTPDEGRTQIAEQFRVIKRPLLTNAFNKGPGMIKNGNLIMVTSALAGEGKSFCTVNLAMSIAMEMDRTVLLVDADVARPTVPKILGLGTERGLMDILLDDNLKLADVLLKTDIEKLTLLTAGRRRIKNNDSVRIALRKLLQ